MKNKIYKLNKNKTAISGRALASTVKTLSNLGPIGKELLENLKISKIDLDKRYPYQIRTYMFEEVYKRFGNISLFACGCDTRGFFPFMEKGLDEFMKKNASYIDF